jgi:hypothetical protein
MVWEEVREATFHAWSFHAASAEGRSEKQDRTAMMERDQRRLGVGRSRT